MIYGVFTSFPQSAQYTCKRRKEKKKKKKTKKKSQEEEEEEEGEAEVGLVLPEVQKFDPVRHFVC